MKFGFIVGTGRCGTTMLAQMLNSHSQICIPHEIQILFETSNNGKRLHEVFENGEYLHYKADDFIKLTAERCPHNFHEYFNYEDFFRRLTYPVPGLQWLITRLYAEIAISRGKSYFFEQTPWYGQRIDLLNDLFPGAKYIHMVRDGRDVAISFARTPWWHDDIGKNLDRWQSEIDTIIDSCSKYLAPEQIIQIKYEDVVVHPEREIRKICQFLDIDFEADMLDPKVYIDYTLYRKNKKSNISSAAQNDWRRSKDTPTFDGSLFAWKKFDSDDFSAMHKRVARTLRSLGYDVDSSVREIPDEPDSNPLRKRIVNFFRRLC